MKTKNQLKNLKIGKVNIGYNLRPKIIAEAAVEHLGSIEVAKRMALEAKKIGVDFIKYQMHLPESEMLPNKIKFWIPFRYCYEYIKPFSICSITTHSKCSFFIFMKFLFFIKPF